jgi:hypothetical protein
MRSPEIIKLGTFALVSRCRKTGYRSSLYMVDLDLPSRLLEVIDLILVSISPEIICVPFICWEVTMWELTYVLVKTQ